MKRAAILAFAGLALASMGRAADGPTPAPTEEKEGTIAGTPVQRANGGWLGIEIRDQCFRMTFYGEKKKPVPADVASVVLWWPVHYQPNNERTELVASDDPAVLASAKVIKPPYAFRLHVILLTDPNSGASHPYGAKVEEPESYVIDFSG